MTTHAKESWLSTRLPYLDTLCATFCQKNRAPGAAYFETLDRKSVV